jgi:hypothetical protein
MNLHGTSVDGFQSVAIMSLTHGQRSRTYGQERVCAHAECGTRLSMYNPMKNCSLHEQLS